MLEVAVEKNSRATLIKNMLRYMEWLQLDGIEVFLGGGSRESDEAAFTLLQELKSSFIAAGHPTLVDYVHVLSRPRRWPKYHDNSSIPVAKATFDIDDHTNITLQRALQYWIDNNCPANKIVLAVIFVARIFKLANVAKKWEQPPELTTMCSLSKGTGFCPYVEPCQKFKEGEWTVGYDDTEGLAPHAFQSDRDSISVVTQACSSTVVRSVGWDSNNFTVETMFSNRSNRSNSLHSGGVSLLSLLMLLLLNPSNGSVNAERVVCGLQSSSTERRGEYRFEIADIPTSLCSHIVYDRMEIDMFSSAQLFDTPDTEESDWKKLSELKRTKPELKLLANIGSPRIIELATEKNSRETLIEDMLQYMERFQIDGIELYWSGGVFGPDEPLFLLIEELKSRFIAAGHPTWEVNAMIEIERQTIDHARLCGLVDYVHILGLGQRKPTYRDNSSTPVAKATFDINDHTNVSLEHALQYWIDNNCPANKIVLVVLLLGQPFTIVNGMENEEEPQELTTFCAFSKGLPVCPYVELCQKFKEGEWTVGYDDTEGLAPHALQNDMWVAYENEASVERKGEIAKRKKIAGVYAFTLDMDDFQSNCGTLYPLTKALSRSFKSTSAKAEATS
ncbi:endochitinase-like [Anopheles moucheti]|uniref:endochitinase-like n=1 Tax=Anopheles moucheti TaxID=186751 RepID=UPI0022F0DA70|nr:endochitinase-like [Anopheles moucheti]